MIEVEKIHLTFRERKLLKQIEKSGISINDERTQSKQFQAILKYNLLKLCFDESFPDIGKDTYDNPKLNAYRAIGDVSRYFVYQNRHKWVEFRAWITLAIAIIALIISILALILDFQQSGIFESGLQPETPQSLPIEQPQS